MNQFRHVGSQHKPGHGGRVHRGHQKNSGTTVCDDIEEMKKLAAEAKVPVKKLPMGAHAGWLPTNLQNLDTDDQ